MDPIFENPAIAAEYTRWMNHFTDDPYAAAGYIGLFDVLRAHFLIVDYFYSTGTGIGGIGPRDSNLLHSAVYRQYAGFAGEDVWQNEYDRCATLVYGLVKDHPFHDANKRTALLVYLYFLHRNNRITTISHKELDDFVVRIAENRLNRHRRMEEFIDTDAPEIRFIADYIRRNSRPSDKREYRLTYKELDQRLRSFSYCLINPHKNFIDVCRIEQHRSLLGLGRQREEIYKLTTIVFPGWKREVARGVVAKVRKATKLVPEKGVDSATFYRGVDSLNVLIADYQGPLQRLANK